MAEAARSFAFGRREERVWSEQEAERRELRECLAQTRVLIHQAYTAFNGTSDSDLIESYVFEINALQSRYSYLLRRIKELDGAEVSAADTELPVPWENAVR